MKTKVVYGNPVRYYVEDREVTEEEYREASRLVEKPWWQKSGRGMGHMMHEFNHPSDALAVHPTQIAEAVEFDSKHGVPTEYLADGRPIMRNRAHQKNYLKIHNYYNRDASYGD